MENKISLVTTTWNYSNTFDIQKTSIYRSFKKFNPQHNFVHYHFNRGHYHTQETEFAKRFGPESEYILYKIVMLRQKLEQLDTEYIIFCDANDVVCMGNVDQLPRIFNLENEIIVGAEKNQWPTVDVKKTWETHGFVDYSGFDVENNHYLNSGTILSKKSNFITMLKSMEDNILSKNINNFRNDQGVYTWYYTAKLYPQIKLDYNTSFSVNTFGRAYDEYYLNPEKKLVSKSNGTAPYFTHDNGWNHGSPKYINHFELRRIYSDSYPHLKNISNNRPINQVHQDYLKKLRDEYNFFPKVIWDVGACVLHWTTIAREVWPNSEYVLFEAMEESEELFVETPHQYAIGVFGEEDNKEVTFYKNVNFPGGNSYYMENPQHSSMANALFANPANQFVRKTISLDTIQKMRNFKMPDLLKLDVQGCEIDILKGSRNVLSHVKHLIVELQHLNYNIGAKTCEESIPIIESMGFKLVTPKFSLSSHADADYHFINKKLLGIESVDEPAKLNILTTGILCNDPLIRYASDELCKAEFEKYFDTRWILITHSQERANGCKGQSQNFKNVSVIVDEESRKNRTGSTRRALVEINEGEYVWLMPEGFIPSADCASKIADLIDKNSSIAIEGTKCLGIDHVIFKMPDSSVFSDDKSMLSFLDATRRNGISVLSEEICKGSVASNGKIEHTAKSDMERLSVIYWNLKYSFHKYTNIYESLLNRKKYSAKSILEIGVAQGASLRTFRDFFPNAKIFGLDIYPESILSEPRIDVVIGDSSEVSSFIKLKEMNNNENFDIAVDDGSHKVSDQLKSFEILWPMIKENGLYIIEDVHNEELIKNELAKIVSKSSIMTFDLRPQSNLTDSGVVVIIK